MLQLSSKAVPIYPGYVAELSASPYMFGASPFNKGYGLKGCGCGPSGGCGCSPVTMAGLRHGGGGQGGRGMGGRSGSGTLSGLNQNVSLDQIIANAFNWLGGLAQSQLPPSYSVPPQYGSTGALSSQLQQWLPYIIIGVLAYKVIK